ncbi:MAG: PKD domain-containing protein, partial [Thermoplasmatales archaeon]|nr:PKD domain-containing protein [Thermoplasmatales archaeon]
DGDGDGDGGYTPSNQPPVADASESQTFGYVDESIDFNGSKSDDPDGTVDLYEWDWDNDGVYDYNSTSNTTTHVFNVADAYSVTLRVTDNEGATDKDTIEVVISKANVPPTKPTIEGTSEGTKDIDYTYNFQSVDLDNDTIQYFINWGDGEVTETEFLPNGTASMQNHSWMSAGKYTLNVYAFDNETVSATNQTTILIDVHLVDGIGYLIDDDADGTYDSFHNDTSGQETDVEKQDDGTYLLDDDGDDSWDWIYDIETDTLTAYSEPTSEPDNTALIVLAIIAIFFLIILGYLVKRSNDKKKAQKKAAEKKSQPKKKTTSKKSKK